jgi:hypothetical protein
MAACPSLPRGSEPAASESPARGRLARANHRDGCKPDGSRPGPDLTLHLVRPPSRAVSPSRAAAASAESPPLDRPAQLMGHDFTHAPAGPSLPVGPVVMARPVRPARVLKAPLLPPSPPPPTAARVPPFVPSPLPAPLGPLSTARAETEPEPAACTGSEPGFSARPTPSPSVRPTYSAPPLWKPPPHPSPPYSPPHTPPATLGPLPSKSPLPPPPPRNSPSAARRRWAVSLSRV